MGYEEKLAKGGFIPPRPKIKSKTIEVKEIVGAAKLVLQPGQRIVDTKIIGEMMALPRGGSTAQYAMPEYKTVIVLECTVYE